MNRKDETVKTYHNTIFRGKFAFETYDTVVCPTCGDISPVGDHCIYCGEPLTQIPAMLPSAKCPKCEQYGPSGDYCSFCGNLMPPKIDRTYMVSDE